ncbi:MAG TPA: hypothetical protein VLI68_02000 [Hanamia sp.]|jgi:hypothetical protein|nr:hypothetical protein [Hanamia sp.]
MKQLKNMKAYRFTKSFIILVLLLGTSISKIQAQDSVAPKTQLSISYFLPVNKVPYLEVNTRKKTGRKFEPVKNIAVNIYFDQPERKNLLGQVTTDSIGKARIGLPPSFKNEWDSLNEFKFIAEESSPEKEPLTAEITIKKAILTIDTTSGDGTRMVTAELKEKNGDNWIPVKDIDMLLSVKRLLGNLSVGDKETYTSDSTGVSSAEFKRDSMPGDQKGNIIIVAQVVDNENYGNLAVEKSVNWGTPAKPIKNFFAQRALWSIRTQTPFWLLFTVYFIVAGIWGTFLYLIFQVRKIKKLGA